MKQLTNYQSSFAHHRLMLSSALSPEVQQCIFRMGIACGENKQEPPSIIDLVCGLYLGYPEQVAQYFQGDFVAALNQNFPKHRFGDDGLRPAPAIENGDSGKDSGSFGFDMKFSDDILRILWLATALANAAGKKTSVQDVVTAVLQDQVWKDELPRYGLEPMHKVANFKAEVESIIVFVTAFARKRWPPPLEFELDGAFQPPFWLEVITPAGAFEPMRLTGVQLNGAKVAEVKWPDQPTARVPVELLKSNQIQLEVEGGTFASVEVIVRGNPVR